MVEESSPPGEFQRSLAERSEHYRLIDQPAEDRAHIRFTGSFEGSDITWDAWLLAQGVGSSARQFIDIARSGYPLRRITIGINVAAIDQAVLLKTIIMIRNYRRLHVGRHEFGNPDRNTNE
jgi:hypothetical protein